MVLTEKHARPTKGDDNRFPLGANLFDHLRDSLSPMVRVGVDQPRLAQHIQVVCLNERNSLTTRAALVAFVLRHKAGSQNTIGLRGSPTNLRDTMALAMPKSRYMQQPHTKSELTLREDDC